MRLIKYSALSFGVGSALLLGWHQKGSEGGLTLHKQYLFETSRNFGHRSMGKASLPFDVTPDFQWIDSSQGRAKIEIRLRASSFAQTSWKYQWILPEGITWKGPLEETLTIDPMGAEQPAVTVTLELEGLDGQANQNVHWRIFSLKESGSTHSLVISTHPHLTEEGRVMAENQAQALKEHSLTKALSRKKEIPRGIQF